MEPFVAKPGETIVGLGFDFDTRLTGSETIGSGQATASAPLVVETQTYTGTNAVADIAVPADAPDGDHTLEFEVTGTLGSTRKATRTIWIRSASE